VKNWRTHEIENEILRRTRNEWIEQTSDSFGANHIEEAYICECGDPDCTDNVSMTRVEYEAVRSVGSHFVIAVDHENPEIERVILENRRFTVVEKMMAAGRMSQKANPRR
jgi:hypothetical protein